MVALLHDVVGEASLATLQVHATGASAVVELGSNITDAVAAVCNTGSHGPPGLGSWRTRKRRCLRTRLLAKLRCAAMETIPLQANQRCSMTDTATQTEADSDERPPTTGPQDPQSLGVCPKASGGAARPPTTGPLGPQSLGICPKASGDAERPPTTGPVGPHSLGICPKASGGAKGQEMPSQTANPDFEHEDTILQHLDVHFGGLMELTRHEQFEGDMAKMLQNMDTSDAWPPGDHTAPTAEHAKPNRTTAPAAEHAKPKRTVPSQRQLDEVFDVISMLTETSSDEEAWVNIIDIIQEAKHRGLNQREVKEAMEEWQTRKLLILTPSRATFDALAYAKHTGQEELYRRWAG